MKTFEDRLENWGRYFGGGTGGYAKSTTHRICELLAISHGKTIRDGYRELQAAVEIDERDAQVIEWCWSRCAYRMEPTLRALLKAHYVNRFDVRVTCRLLGITFRRYEATVSEAVRQFQQAVDLFENVSDNSRKTDELPS